VKFMRLAFLLSVCFYLFAAISPAQAAATHKVANGRKAKISGTVISREGNAVRVQENNGGSAKIVNIDDKTKINRDGFLGRTRVHVTALLPGLTIHAKGVLNAEGELDAKEVNFHPDQFAIAVALEQQIMANQAAASRAQTTADQGVANAATAQSAAEQAQGTANEGVTAAQAAGSAAAADAVGVQAVNQRVSNLGTYAAVATAEVYFANDSYKLSSKARAALDQLISANSNDNGYLIAIAGYTSNTGSANYNQTLSERRAAAVAQYLRENAAVPMWRIVVPAGYGETHPAVSNDNSKDRALNRRVEVSILVSKGQQADSQVATFQP